MHQQTIIDLLTQTKDERNIIFVQIDDWAHMLVIPPSFEYSIEETRQVSKEIQKIILADKAVQTPYQSLLWQKVLHDNHRKSAASPVWSNLIGAQHPRTQVAFFVDTRLILSKYQSLVNRLGYQTRLLESQNLLQIDDGQFELTVDATAIATHCLWTCTNTSDGIFDSLRFLSSEFRLFKKLHQELGPAFPTASFWRADKKLFVMQDKIYGTISYQQLATSLRRSQLNPRDWLSGLDLRDLLAIDEAPVISVRSPNFSKARPNALCESHEEYLLAVEVENHERLRTVPVLDNDILLSRLAHYKSEARAHLEERHYETHAWLCDDDSHFGLLLVGDKIANIAAFPESLAGAVDITGRTISKIRALSTSENSIILAEANTPWTFIESLAIKADILLTSLYPDGADALYFDQTLQIPPTPCGHFDVTWVPAPFFDLIDTANDPKIALPPGRSDYLRGLAFELVRNWQLAALSFKKAYTFDASDGDICFALGRAMSELREFQNAIPFLKRAFDTLPDDPDVANSLAMAYLECDDREHATHVMEHAVSLEPDDAQLLANLGRCYFSCQKWHEAESVLTKAIEYAPNFSDAHATMAQLRWRLGDVPSARKHARKAFAANPSNRMVQDLLWALTVDDSPPHHHK